jgi:hypothetical protein
MSVLYPVLLGVALAGAVAGDLYDVAMTEKGIKAGVAVEGNDWLVGQKPSALALYLRDSLVLAFCVAPTALLATVFHNLPLAYGALISPVIYGYVHLQGGLAWKKLGVKL